MKADKADQFKTLADFAGKSVGAQAATTKLDIIADSMPVPTPCLSSLCWI